MGMAIMNTENLMAINDRASAVQQGLSSLAACSSSFFLQPRFLPTAIPCSVFEGIILWSLEVAK